MVFTFHTLPLPGPSPATCDLRSLVAGNGSSCGTKSISFSKQCLFPTEHTVCFSTCERFLIFVMAIYKMRFYPNSKLQTHPDNLIMPPFNCIGKSPLHPFGTMSLQLGPVMKLVLSIRQKTCGVIGNVRECVRREAFPHTHYNVVHVDRKSLQSEKPRSKITQCGVVYSKLLPKGGTTWIHLIVKEGQCWD